ncbi:lectin-like protein [Vulcanococcus limneticus]|uniref:lectin-like protein n=1 Tax=Vulcanococcus limneticus TaxID=2170428 RepID=UPI00398BCB92
MLDGSNAKQGSEGLLQSYVSQWSAGNFKNLPQIVLLSADDISGARGAYADSTDTIYLNQDWLLTASDEEIQRVLTEELGHYLDDQLNQGDSKGDEGEYFSYQLFSGNPSQSQLEAFAANTDQIEIRDDFSVLLAEASQAYQSPSFGNITPSPSATYWTNQLNSQFTGIINGSSGDDVYTGVPYSVGPFNATIYELTINDSLGNTFISSSGYNGGGGPNGSIVNSNFNLGDGYVRIDSTITSGNYGYNFVGNNLVMGGGNSDINVVTGGSAYYAQTAFSSNLNAGAGTDSLNVSVNLTTDWIASISGSSIDMGADNDYLSSVVTGHFDSQYTAYAIVNSTVIMGGGNDTLRAWSTRQALSESSIEMGDGNDIVDISGIAISSKISGGLGFDTLRIRQSFYSVIVSTDANGNIRIVSGDPENPLTLSEADDYQLELSGFESVVFDDMAIDRDVYLQQSDTGKLYRFVDGPTWIEASQNAQSLGGNLASISSATENSVVYSLLDPSYRSTANAWIGFNRLNNYVWGWSDGSAVTYTNWRVASNEPSGDGNWAQMRHYDGGTWNDFRGPYGYDGGVDFYETTRGIAEIPYLSFGSSIYVVVPASTWTEGQAKAVSLGGNLVTINSYEENQWLNQAYGQLHSSYWMGINDIKTEGMWVWVSGEQVDYTNWLPGSPDNELQTGDEDWGELNYYYSSGDNQTGYWNDNNNDGSGPRYAIVEITNGGSNGGGGGTGFDYSVSNNLVITGAGKGTLDGRSFEDIFTFDLSIGNDEISINESAGNSIPMTVEGGDGIDTLNANSLKNKLILTGINQGTLDGIQFSGIENINLGSGNDEVYIRSGGMLTGLLNGGSAATGGGTVIYVPDDGNVDDYQGDSDGYTNPDGSEVTSPPPPPTTPPIEFKPIAPGYKFNGGLNSIFMNDDANTASINGPGLGVVDGTDFTNFYALDLKGGDDFATINPTGYLFGKLNGGLGFDTLSLSEDINLFSVDESLIGRVDKTDIESFEVINLLGGDDSVEIRINALPPNFDGIRQSLAIDGGIGSDNLTLKMTREEVQYLKAEGTFDDLQAYLADPVGKIFSVSFSSVDLTLTGFENVGFFNQSPTSISSSSSNFDEDSVVGTEIAILTAFDPDQQDQFTYKFVGSGGQLVDTVEIFEIQGNSIKLTDIPNFETKSSYQTTLRVFDDFGAFYDQAFDFSVTDVNEAPTAVTLTNKSTSLLENTVTTNRIKVADIQITDDALGTNAVTLSGADAALFEADAGVLYVKAGAVLDYETNPILDVTVSVADSTVGGSTPVTATYALAVSDIPEATAEIGIAAAPFVITPIVISGSLNDPKVETYTTTRGKGKNATTTYNWTNINLDNPTRPLDALVVNGGDANNVITAAGFKDDPASTTIEIRAAFSGLVVIDGKSGADTITGGIGTNWLIGGGVSATGTVDTLTGTLSAKDIFDLRSETSSGAWSDAYAVGHAVINNFAVEDFIVLAGQKSDYVFNSKVVQTLNKRGKVTGETVSFEILKKSSNDLIATIATASGGGFTSLTDLSTYTVFGQSAQDPFEVVLPGSAGGTII